MSLLVYKNIFLRKKRSIEEEISTLVNKGLISENYYNNLTLTKTIITTSDNYELVGYLTKCENSIGCVLLSHGVSCNHGTMLGHVDFFKKHGYDVFLIDQRGHGNSSKATSTFGINEKKDMVLWLDFLKKLNYKNIGIFGHSMGASIALLTCNETIRPDFIISESAFSNFNDLIKWQLNKKRVPDFFAIVLGFLCKIVHGLNLKDINIITTIKDSNIPILFIHGSEDNLIPWQMSRLMSDISNNPIYLVEKCNHHIYKNIDVSLSYYENIINSFLKTLRK